MRLYDRDYTSLLPDEREAWQSLQRQEVVGTIGTSEIRTSRFRDYPKAARHFEQLFPNNYLDIVELQDESRLSAQLVAFQELLDSENATERKILDFIRERCAYFLIGSILKKYFHFGHHSAHLFPEFQLGNSYKVDYLLVGKNSGGWHFVFVELEAPTGRITLGNGNLGEVFRNGVAQVDAWETWLEARFNSVTETFAKSKRPDQPLPDEFGQFDRSRIHFVVIAGRRSDFNDYTYRTCRKSPHLLIHYDNIVDAAASVIGKATY